MAVVAMAAVLAGCTSPVTDLGGATSEAYGINRAGVVVGVSDLAGSSAQHAFKRLPDNTAVDLGTLAGHTTSLAIKVNDAGTVVGLSSGTSSRRVVRWDATDQITDLGFDAFPRDLDDAGVVVGFDLVLAGRARGHAFVFDPLVGEAVALPELAGAEVSYAWGLNNVGQVVGTVGVNGKGVPVLWDLTAGTVTDLRTMTGLDHATDIGDDGTIVGRTPGGDAAIWKPGSTAPTPLGAGFAVAFAVNDHGTVIGSTLGADVRAFRWHADTGLVWLGTDDEATNAYAINASGGIVGYANGKAAFLFPTSS